MCQTETNWLSSFISSLFFFIPAYLHFQSFSGGRPWCCPTVDKYRTLLPQLGLDWRRRHKCLWHLDVGGNPEEKGQGECRRRDSALKSSNRFKKWSLRCTFRTRPAPWCCSIPPAPACEAQPKVMKAEKECQMITKSPRTPPYHGERRLAFYCQLHLPSLAAPSTITVLTRLNHTVAVRCWGPPGWSLTFFNAWRHKERDRPPPAILFLQFPLTLSRSRTSWKDPIR